MKEGKGPTVSRITSAINWLRGLLSNFGESISTWWSYLALRNLSLKNQGVKVPEPTLEELVRERLRDPVDTDLINLHISDRVLRERYITQLLSGDETYKIGILKYLSLVNKKIGAEKNKGGEASAEILAGLAEMLRKLANFVEEISRGERGEGWKNPDNSGQGKAVTTWEEWHTAVTNSIAALTKKILTAGTITKPPASSLPPLQAKAPIANLETSTAASVASKSTLVQSEAKTDKKAKSLALANEALAKRGRLHEPDLKTAEQLKSDASGSRRAPSAAEIPAHLKRKGKGVSSEVNTSSPSEPDNQPGKENTSPPAIPRGGVGLNSKAPAKPLPPLTNAIDTVPSSTSPSVLARAGLARRPLPPIGKLAKPDPVSSAGDESKEPVSKEDLSKGP